MLEELAKRLEEAGIGIRGRTIMVYFMPPNVDGGVLLRIGLDGAEIDHELPGYRPRASFQLIVRAKTYDIGFDVTRRASEALTLPAETTLGSLRFNYCRPRHDPIVYPRSSGAGLEFSVNFDVNYMTLS